MGYLPHPLSSGTRCGLVPVYLAAMDQPPANRAKTLPLPYDLVSWCDLSPELIARMSKYVDIGSDLTSLCVVVGSDTAARIRQAYLTDNDAYLAYALSLVHVKGNPGVAAATSRIRFWMAVNANWRDRCTELSHQQYVWQLRDVSLALLRSQVQPKTSLGHRVLFDEDGPRAVGDPDGIPVVPGSSFGIILTMASASTGDGMVRLFVTVPVQNIFTSPVIATRLGLVEVVKTLIDKGFFGVHDFLPYSLKRDHHVSLVGVALTHSINNSVLRYLLSRDDFDPNGPWHRDHPHEKPVNLAARAGGADPDALKMILDHPNCSADNVAENGTNGRSALHHLCNCTDDKKYAVEKMKVLLAAGANPELRDARGKTPFDFLIIRLKDAGTEEDIGLTTELLATLQNAILARRH